MAEVALNGHTDTVVHKVEADIREHLERAVADAIGDTCVTSLIYKIKIDAAPPKRENEKTKKATQRKPIVSIERIYEPPPVKEKDELLVLSVAELPLYDQK